VVRTYPKGHEGDTFSTGLGNIDSKQGTKKIETKGRGGKGGRGPQCDDGPAGL